MSKNWFSRLLFSYLPLFAISMIVLIIIFFAILNEYARKETEHVNRLHITHVKDTLEATLTSVERMVTREFLTNSKLQAYFEPSNLRDPFQSYEAYRILNDLVVMDEFIHSIYIYRSSDDRVISNTVDEALQQFADRAFIEQHMQDGEKEGWSDQRMFADASPISVISLVKKLPFGSGTMGMFVVNVESTKVLSLFSELSRTELSKMYLVGRTGKSMLGDHLPEGVKSTLRSELTGWEIHSVINRQSVPYLISAISRTWLIIGVLFLAGCFVGLIFISRRNYKPVEYILARIHSYSTKKSHLDDFQFIDSSIEALLEQTQEYKERSRYDLIYKRKHYFLELLEGNLDFENNRLDLDWTNFGLLHSARFSAVVVVEMDQYNQFVQAYHTNDQNLLKFALFSVLKEMAELGHAAIWQEWTSNHQIAAILQFAEDEDSDEGNVEARVKSYCYEVRNWVEKHLSFTITLAMGPTVVNMSELYQSYHTATEALNYKATVGANSVIMHTVLTEERQGEIYDQLVSIRQMSNSFRLGKQEEWIREFHDLFNEIQQGAYSYKELVNLMNYLIYHLNNEMSDLSSEYVELWHTHALNPLYASLNEFETFDELRIKLLTILQRAFDEIALIRESNSRYQLLQIVESYINQNYGNPDLSLIQVSDEVNLQPAQLSRLFKDEFGEKFVDYIARVRVGHAKALLIETDESILEIGKRVGYVHSFSFIRLFKKIVGETPGVYRKSMKENGTFL